MGGLEVRARSGTLRVVARDEEAARAAADLALPAAEAGSRGCDPVEFCGEPAFFKRSALRGRTSLRYALKRRLLLRPLPRLLERRNLTWLRERLFQAPEPLAAGFLERACLPRFQFLVTRAVEGARTLERFLLDAPPDERAAVLDEVAREAARMHALHFVHRDLWPRNILVTGEGQPSRVWFLDCWAGGPGPQLRGPAYDLACLLLRADGTLDDGEQRRLLDTYLEERVAQRAGTDPSSFQDAVARESRRLARKLGLPARAGISP